MTLYSVVVCCPRDFADAALIERMRVAFQLDQVIDANAHPGPFPIKVPQGGSLVLASDSKQIEIPPGVVSVHFKTVLRRIDSMKPRPAGDAIGSAWRSYRANVMPGRVSSVQEIECRRALYAGAHALFGEVVKAADAPESEDQQVERLEAMRRELAAFQERVLRGDA